MDKQSCETDGDVALTWPVQQHSLRRRFLLPELQVSNISNALLGPATPNPTPPTMRFSFLPSLLLVGASAVSAASSWGFEDATLTVLSKGSGVGGGFKEK